MRDYEKLIATAIHGKLKEKIKGKVFVEVNEDDELFVKITSYGDLRFEKKFPNFSDRFMNGFTTDYAVYEVEKDFKKFIMRNYFL